MTLPARITRKQCATCTHFRPRDPASAWPLAGVSPLAAGKCALPRYGRPEEARRPWQAETDRCAEWAKPTPLKPVLEAQVERAPDGGLMDARRREADRIRLLKGGKP